MTVAKVISTGISNLGYGGTKSKNPFVDMVGVIATTKSFSFSTVAAAATESGWTDGIKAKTVFPFPQLWDVEDQGVVEVYAESANAKRKKTRKRVRRYKFMFDNAMDVHRAMQSFDNTDLRWFIFDGNNNIKFYKDGDYVKGFSCSMVSVEAMTDASQSGDAPALSSIVVDFDNSNEWDTYGDYITPSWAAKDLEPLTNVYLEQVGVATATDATIRVYSYTGYNAAGAIDKIGIAGLVIADFTATTEAGVDQTAALSAGTPGTMTDNGDGTYTFDAAGLVKGTVNLVAASSLSGGYFDSHFGTADGEATLTITT